MAIKSTQRLRGIMVIANTRDTRGALSEYKPEYAAEALSLCLLGATDKELAGIFGCGTNTINRWAREHDDFGMAIALGGARADAKVAHSMYQRATGYSYIEILPIKVKTGQYTETVEMVEVERHVPADVTAGKFWLINRQKDHWADASKIEHSGEINSGEKRVEDMSDDELFAKIEEAKNLVIDQASVIDLEEHVNTDELLKGFF
jgi:hypothetical protein